MRFIENISKDRYEKFAKNHKKSHFLQSYAWGQFSQKEKNLIPHYIGMEDENENLVATALLLEKKLPFHLCYFYAPRGFLIDYKNEETVKVFTSYIKNYSKKRKAIFVKIDPDLIYNSEDNSGNKIIENQNQELTILKKAGYKHLGFTKNFETMQPRYTFRINMDKPWDEIENSFSKTTKQRIKKAEDLLVDIKVGDKKDIHTFYNLMILTENRKDFITHDEKYYQSLYEIWNKDNSCNLFLGTIDLDKIINKQMVLKKELTKELEKIPKEKLSKTQNTKKQELQKRIDKINQDLSKYEQNKKEYGKNITLSAHFIIEYQDKAWVLYAGNHNILTDTYTNYATYKEHIKYHYNKNIKIYDQFGTIGDLRNENPLLGLHEFKKKFGGDYIEFTGEFDYVINPLMYFIFTKLVPIYRNCIKNIAKKKRGKK